MGHPIHDPELDAKVRKLHEAGTPLSAIARSCKIGINRVRRICGLQLPPSQTAAGQAAYRERHPDTRTKTQQPETQQPEMKPQETNNQKTITIPLTPGAYDRLASIAETAYLSPEAFAATLVASYLSYQPAQIVLDPYDPDETEEDAGEESEAEESEGEATEEETTEESEESEDGEFVFREDDFDWLKPGTEFVVKKDDRQIGVRCVSIWTFTPKSGKVLAEDRRVHDAGDAIRCVALNGEFEGELDFFPEEVVFAE